MEESKNITLKVNSKLYDQYRQLCKKEGWIVSRQFEKLMEDELEKEGGKRSSDLTFIKDEPKIKYDKK